jgi:hypothetical protein
MVLSGVGVMVEAVIGLGCGVDSGIVARIRGDRESPLAGFSILTTPAVRLDLLARTSR